MKSTRIERPAIDLIEMRKISKRDYSTKKIYNEDPLEVALSFETTVSNDYLVIDGAKAGRIINHRVLGFSLQSLLVIDFGGGLKSSEDLRIAFECGAGWLPEAALPSES